MHSEDGSRALVGAVELRDLRYFVAAAEQLHFTRAADTLHVRQQALSAAMQRLEKRLGVTLFARTTRRTRLTPAGEAFLPRAKQVLAAAEAAVAAAVDAESGTTGRLALAISRSALQPFGAAVVQVLRARWPDVQVEVSHDYSQPLIDRLLEGQVNAAIVYCPERRPDLRYQRLSDQPALAVMHPEHRFAPRSSLTIADLADEVIVLAEPAVGACYNTAVLGLFQRAGYAPETIYFNGYLPPRGYDPASMIGVTTEVALYGVPPASFERVCVPISGQTLPFDLVWQAEREPPLVTELCRVATRVADEHDWPR